MYLLVFITLILSMLTVYAQVMTVATAHLAGTQTGIGHAMIEWHSGAVSVAASVIDTNPSAYLAVRSAGCSLGWFAPDNINRCPPPLMDGASVNGAGRACSQPLGILTGDSSDNYAICNVYNRVTARAEPAHLAPGFSALAYQFYSVVYQDPAGANHVITFVPPAAVTAGGLLTLANGTPLGITSGELMAQLKHLGVEGAMLGSVYGGKIVTRGLSLNGAPVGFSYTLPVNDGKPIAPDGSVAIVSSPDGF